MKEAGFIGITGRMLINVASLNTAGGAGSNYNEITRANIVVKKGDGYKIVSVPVISGNMLRHWIFRAFVDHYTSLGGKNLSKRARRYNAVRFQSNNEDDLKGMNLEEKSLVKAYADCDVFGFLVPNVGLRRESVLKTSFLIPPEDFLEEIMQEYDEGQLSFAVTHNRVDVDETGKIGKGKKKKSKSSEEEQESAGEELGTAMMLFEREYSSAEYSFLIIAELDRIGVTSAGEKVIDEKEAGLRRRALLLAIKDVLRGRFGASQARALPIMKLTEVYGVKGDRLLPNPVSAHYKEYKQENDRLFKEAEKVTDTKDLDEFLGE